MTSQLHHETANTDSLTTLHAVLDDAAQGVFQGKVVVARDAQHVDAQQQSRAMMLSERAHMSAKPELEIYADDVAGRMARRWVNWTLMRCSFCAVAELMRRLRATCSFPDFWRRLWRILKMKICARALPRMWRRMFPAVKMTVKV